MKVYLVSILILAAVAGSCNRRPKDLATLERGMTRTEVLAIVGEPQKKDVINSTEIWVYPDSARTVVFRKDTVYTILTTTQARLDSMASWIGKTDGKLEKGFKKAGAKLDSAVKKIGDKLD